MSYAAQNHPHLPPEMAEMAVNCETSLWLALEYADEMRREYRPGVAVPKALQSLRNGIAQAYEEIRAINGRGE